MKLGFFDGLRVKGLSLGTFVGSGEINRTAPAITPTLGAELFVNPGAEGTYVSGLAPNWQALADTGTKAESADAHGGSKAQALSATAVQREYIGPTNAAVVVGTWYLGSIWAKAVSGSARINLRPAGGVAIVQHNPMSATYAQYVMSGRATDTGLTVAMDINGPLTGAGSYIIDDASLKALTFSTCLSLLGNIGRKNGTYQCTPTVTVGTATGIVIEYLDENNFVIVYINGFTAFLVSRIAGTYTIVKSGAITYGAGKVLKAIVNGTTHQLFYDGTQVGTDGTIDNSGMGTQVYGFNTYAGNSIGVVTTNP